MPKFHVRSGSLQITIIAEDGHEAAVESLQWWGEGNWGNDGEAGHRRHLGEQIVVEQLGGQRLTERFITFHLLARLNGETPDAAWRRVLANFDPDRN
jgi:hypothetical protein